jgi:transcriptional regulator with XRE-family HTH domain
MGLPEVIQAQRAQLRLSQTQLAQRVGVRQATISEWESGKSAPSAMNLVTMAHVFGMTVADLHALIQRDDHPMVIRESPPALPPDWLARRVDDAVLELARSGATNEQARYIREQLQSEATLRFILRNDDGTTRSPLEQRDHLELLIEGMSFWVERSAAIRAGQSAESGRPAVVEDEPIPAPRGKTHGEAVKDFEKSNEKKPKRA